MKSIFFEHLGRIKDSAELKSLNTSALLELQRALKILGYSVGEIDGSLGRKTTTAWHEFKIDNFQANLDIIGPGSLDILCNKAKALLSLPSPTTRKDAIDAIVEFAPLFGLPLKSQIAYILATAQHETNDTFLPVREAYWLSEEWRRQNLSYYPWYGRGLVQITHKSNYGFYADLLGEDFTKNLDLVLKPDNSLFILLYGFKYGTFTGRRLENYVNPKQSDFFHARRCINGLDKASKISAAASSWLKSL
jgi:peptidoglycan hydrolase-like protein with peptidoglycan-binding domain